MFDTLFDKLAHLPVATICNQVAEYYANQMIPIVTSEVASGKTMLIPAACALQLKDDPVDPVVYVLQPTRFLSNNAAESLWSLLDNDRHLVGVINSNRSDDDSVLHPNNRVVFTTVGYALSSGILKTRNNFILDEAHETSIELSLAKAYLHERLKRGELINVAELSATIDVANELEYWGDNSIPFTTKGSAFPVEFLHRPAIAYGSAVLELIQEHNRTGILVFVSGVEEIEEAVTDISQRLFHENIEFEIESVHGNSSGQQRKAASRDRQAPVKILVGTNVLESGVSLSWVDGGISSGDTKVMYARGNVRRLHKEELPRWRIEQQRGRVGRFKPGVFILAHPTPIDHRPEMAVPDIVRLPLTELVMHCTAYPDIHVRDLEFTPREQPVPEAITAAIDTLVQYGLIEETAEGRIILTEDGKLTQALPLSYRAAAAVCEAHKLNLLGEMLPLIAMLDMGDMRFSYRQPMIGAYWTTSDPVMQVMTIVQYLLSPGRSMNRSELNEAGELYNINIKKYFEYKALVQDLEKKTGQKAHWNCYRPITEEKDRLEFDRLTKQVIFRAMTSETYPVGIFGVAIPTTEFDGRTFRSAQEGSNTSVSSMTQSLMLTGSIRVVTPKRGLPFAVIEQMTAFTEDDVRHLIKAFGRERLVKIESLSTNPTPLGDFLSGKKKEVPAAGSSPFSSIIDRLYAEAGVPRRGLSRLSSRFSDGNLERSYGVTREEIPEPKPVEDTGPKVGSLGSLLAEALAKPKK